jgi:hypothetical protein
VVHEVNTSDLQARILTSYSSRLVYQVRPGPSERIVFPKDGPFDVRRGYTQLPDFEKRLLSRGFVIKEQANFSHDLARIAELGITPPFREPTDIGLLINGADGNPIFQATSGKRLFSDYEQSCNRLAAIGQSISHVSWQETEAAHQVRGGQHAGDPVGEVSPFTGGQDRIRHGEA